MGIQFGSRSVGKSRRALGSLLGIIGFSFAFAAPVMAAGSNADFVGFYKNDEGTPLLEMINGAESQIDIEIYEMTNKRFRTAIRQALKRGIKIRIVMEPNPVGGKCPVFEAAAAKEDATCKDLRSLVKEVKAKRGQVVAFDKEELCGVDRTTAGKSPNCFEHGKIVVKDRAVALISSGNFNSTNLCDKSESPATCNRDYTVVTDDAEVVNGLEQIVTSDLKATRYNLAEIVRGTLAEKLTVSPLSLQPLVDFIATAQESVEVENQYLNDPTLNEALVTAARRGVKVSVMVSSACAFGKPSQYERNKVTKIYSKFDEVGVRSRFFTRKMKVAGVAGYLHAKAIVVDSRRAWVGSVNGSTTALTLNREFGLFFDKQDWVSKLSATINQDLDASGAESWEESLDCQKDFASGKFDDESSRVEHEAMFVN